MNPKHAILAAFIGTCGIIMFRDFKNPDKSWPFPVPPPYRFTWAAVAFAMCALVSDLIDPKIGAVVAGGLFMGIAFNIATKTSVGPGAKEGGDVTPKNNSPVTGSTPIVPT